jgi:hypothetical protein
VFIAALMLLMMVVMTVMIMMVIWTTEFLVIAHHVVLKRYTTLRKIDVFVLRLREEGHLLSWVSLIVI